MFRDEFEAYQTHMNDGMDKMKKKFEEYEQSALVMSSTLQSDNSASVASLREILERHQTTMGTHEASLGNTGSEMEAFKRDHNAAQETALTTIRSQVERHKSTANTLVVPLEKQIQVLQADKTQLPTMAHVNECLQKVQTGAEELAMLPHHVDTEVTTVSRKVEATATQEEKDHRDVEAKISLLTRQAQGRDADAEDIKNEVSQARQDLRNSKDNSTRCNRRWPLIIRASVTSWRPTNRLCSIMAGRPRHPWRQFSNGRMRWTPG